MTRPESDPVPSTAGVRRVAILGCTGSIGTNALDVAAALPDRIRVTALVAHSQGTKLAEQCRQFRPRMAVLTDPQAARGLDRSQFPRETELCIGPEAVAEIAAARDVDVVVSAIVGAAGLQGTWSAVKAGKVVALANKETLVVAGPLVMALARQTGATLLPVDSEHSAIFQALAGGRTTEIERIVLTASGGPFRGRSLKDLETVTRDDALAHPTWRMGPKITIDSATLMNKALEVIEARWLFDVPPERIEVVVHPESMIHGFVEFRDGSVLAQLSPPDMRLPIQYALTWPERVPGPARKLDWRAMGRWQFEPPDRATFPAIDLGYDAARRGGTAGAVLNAANEAAVAAFLDQKIPFLDIVRLVRAAVEAHDIQADPTLDGLLAADAWARQEVTRWIPK